MKVKAIWEFDADVSDISPEHVDVDGHAKDLAKNELSWWMGERGRLFADEFTFEVVKEKSRDERRLEAKKKSYKTCADELFLLREIFKESGFTDEEAFELITAYVRQTTFENILTNESRDNRRTISEMRRSIERLK